MLIKYKNIFECFSCFWKVFCSYKNVKISKTVLPCFGNSVPGWSNHMSQSQAHIEIFCGSLVGHCPSRKKYLEYFSKFGFLMFLATHSDDLFTGGRSSRKRSQRFFFRSLPRDSFAGRTSSCEKHLDKFFKIFFLSVLVTGPSDLLAT